MAAGYWLMAAAVVGCICAAAGCSQEPVYTSKDTVVVTYQNRQYLLRHYDRTVQTPFKYRFEDDGDVDIFINGLEYDIDNPYDIDTKNKKAVIKKSSVSSSSTKTKKR